MLTYARDVKGNATTDLQIDRVANNKIHAELSNEVVFLWNRTLVAFVDKLSSTTVDFIRSEGELKNCTLYGFKKVKIILSVQHNFILFYYSNIPFAPKFFYCPLPFSHLLAGCEHAHRTC